MDLTLCRLEAGDGLAGDRVAPPQLTALPGDVRVQGLAVSSQDPVLLFLDGYEFVPTPASRPPWNSPGFVEPPVLEYALSGLVTLPAGSALVPVLREVISVAVACGGLVRRMDVQRFFAVVVVHPDLI